MGCSATRDKYIKTCEGAFSWYGKKVGKYPWVFIILSLIVNGVLGCLLLIGIESVNDVEEVYVPIGNQAAKDRNKAQDLFPDLSGTAFYPQHITNDGKYGEIIVRALDGSSVLTERVINETADVVQVIKAFSFKDSNNSLVDFQTVCARQMGFCVVDGDFILRETFLDDLRAGDVSYPHYNLGYKSVDLSAYLGDVTQTNGTLFMAKYLKLRFTLRQDTSKFTSLSDKWEDTFLNEMEKIGEVTTLTEISHGVSDSLNVELSSNTGGDIIWFSLTFTLMITYACIVTTGGNCVSTKGHLAAAGVLAAGLGILSGFGIASRILPFTNIVGVMPFLVIGVGVDDTFVLISGWSENREKADIKERLAATMRTSGIAVTLTSATDVVAFLIGLISSFQGVRIFCLYTGLAILFCYINQVTFFAACLAIHGRRVADNRHCVTCRKVKSRQEMTNREQSQQTMSNFVSDVKKRYYRGTRAELGEITLIIHADEPENLQEIRTRIGDETFFGENRNPVSAKYSDEIEICQQESTNIYSFQLSHERALNASEIGTLSICSSSGSIVTFIFTPTVADDIKGTCLFYLEICSCKKNSILRKLCSSDLKYNVNFYEKSFDSYDQHLYFVSSGRNKSDPVKNLSLGRNAPSNSAELTELNNGLKVSPSSHSVVASSLTPGLRLRISCCSGEPSDISGEDENCFQWGPRKLLPYVLSFPAKVVVVLTFLVYIGASIWGAVFLQQGLDLKNLIAPSSYFYRYTNWNNDHFQTNILITFFVNEPMIYSEESTRKQMENLFGDIQNDKDIKSDFLISWLKVYQGSPFYNQTTEADFIKGMKSFVLHNPIFGNDVNFGSNSSEITSSRFHFQSLDTPTSYDQGQLMIRMRDIASKSNLPVFAYAPPFIYFEQFNAILSNTLQTVGVAAAAMFVLSIIFMPYPFVFISVTVAMMSVLTGVFGFMYWWDLTLSSITMIHLVMSTGFSIDYCVHISHAVMQKSGQDSVQEALMAMGGPILNGAMSSFLGILFLLASESYIFLSFFKVMLLVILFGIAHSVCFLPVLFSFFLGGRKRCHRIEAQ